MLSHNESLNITVTDRQKRRTETDIRTNRRTSRHRQTRDRTEKRQEGQDRSRDKKQKTTDENQETRRETRTVVRYGAHCDAWVGGCVMVVLCCYVLLVVFVVVWLFVLCACASVCWRLLSGGRLPSPPLRWRFALSSLEVATVPLLWWPRHQGARDTRGRTGGQHWASRGKTFVFNVYPCNKSK